MPITNAEKQRRYREKLKNNPEKQEEIRKKKLARIKKKTIRVKDMTENERTDIRNKWRSQKRKQKLKQTRIQPVTIDRQKKDKPIYQIRLKKVRIAYKKALSKIENLKRTLESTRKRAYRIKLQLTSEIEKKDSKIDLLQTRNEVLENMVKAAYTTSNNTVKRHIKTTTINETRKHNNTSGRSAAQCLGVKRIHEYKKKHMTRRMRIKEDITKFYSRDDISRITAGKRECRTENKEKKQIRYLTDTLANLYEVYKSEGGQYSFTSFFRYKPFYVLSPTLQSRNTCMCVKHSNMDFLLKSAKTYGILDRDITLKDALSRVVCDTQSFECMYNKCLKCTNKKIDFKITENNKEDQVKWCQWESVKHKYFKKDNKGTNEEMETRKTVKQTKTGTVSELIQHFNEHIVSFKKHYFNMKIQQSQYQQCIRQLGPHEALIICDFSENYESKLSEEIQSMHFGASKQQITLHCGVVYFKNRCQSFCSVSDDLCHEPPGIWAHLFPVISCVKRLDPNIKVIHFFSDGPTSQYRQKKNFYLQSLFTAKLNLNYTTWSYSESGHGKGVADGIGGSVKRSLDRQVSYGHDIKNADDAYNKINEVMKSIKCFLIPPKEVENIKQITPNNLIPLYGTYNVHQIITTAETSTVLHRVLSCYCGTKPGLCSCYFPKQHLLLSSALNKHKVSLKNTDSCDETNITFQVEAVVAANVIPDTSTDKYSMAEGINQSFEIASSGYNDKKILKDGDMVGNTTTKVNRGIFLPGGNITNGLLNSKPTNIYSDGTDKDLPISISPVKQNDEASTSKCSKRRYVTTVPILNKKIKILLPTRQETENIKQERSKLTTRKETENIKQESSKILTTWKETDNIKQERSKLTTRKETENIKQERSKSLKTIITRNFICGLCNLRQLFAPSNMTQCISCKKWVCRACAGQVHAIDYICDKCFQND